MRYKTSHIRRLRRELARRLEILMDSLPRYDVSADSVEVDAVAVRLAVDDFKSILTETRRLK